MSKLSSLVSKSAIASFFSLCGTISAATVVGDLSKYRDFQFATGLPAVAKQLGVDVSEAKVVQSRPALIQELQWRPQSFGRATEKESVNDVVFGFYNGELYRIVINYDRYATEGMTTADIVEAVSRTYGPAAKLGSPDVPSEDHYGDTEEIAGRWQDPQYSFDLIRSSYGPSFRLVGVLRRLHAPAQAAIAEAQRLDIQEAPQRDAARQASEEEAVKARLDASRLVNRPRFRP